MSKNMLTINAESTNGWFEKFYYPGGEMQVRLTQKGVDALEKADTVNVISQARTADQLVTLLHLDSAIYSVIEFSTDYKLIISYLPYSRADRRFKKGDTCGLDVVCSMLRETGFHNIFTLDVHNPSMVFQDNIINVSAEHMIKRAMEMFVKNAWENNFADAGLTVLFPDKGAADRYEVPTEIGYNKRTWPVQVLYATKKRNPETGVFEGFDVPDVGEFKYENILIVDDICDGGGTFVGIADIIKSRSPLAYMGLYVTHGIFSKGMDIIFKFFNKIYTTNSIRSKEEMKLMGYKNYHNVHVDDAFSECLLFKGNS
jgi:ribose-phosphate pyrophosphokinase